MPYLRTLYIALTILSFTRLYGQSTKSFQTFNDTRVINSHSCETLPVRKLDFRISHRFGDIGGVVGGWQTFYGLENANDVLLGFEYGITNKFTVGINRCVGAGPLKKNLNGLAKIQVLEQEEGKSSFSFSILGLTTYSTMDKSETQGALNYFGKQAHRFSYHAEVIAAKKFGTKFSLQLSGGVTHRNLVSATDENSIISVGAATRIKVSKSTALILEAKKPFSNTREGIQHMPIGLGIEWETGSGHVFQMNLTNASGISETDYIPYTDSDWSKGQFRLGFTISRLFSI